MIAKTIVERSSNTVSERPPAHSPLTPDRGQIPPSLHGESQRPVSIPSRPSPLQSAATPGSEVRNFAVLISSPPRPLRITSPLDFGQNETQDELAIGVSVPSSARRKRPQGTPAIKIDNEPSLTPKRKRLAYRHSKSIAAADSVQNKRGRPFRTSEIVTKAVVTDQTNHRRRRRSKLPPSAIDLPLPEPKFIPFLCEWEGCPAELQNLETLRAHIFTVHNKKRPSGILPCLWTNCSPTSDALDNVKLAPNDQRKILHFKTKEEWQDHVNRSHLVPLAWHMGDGPKGTSLQLADQSEPEISLSWLSDTNGRQVTPSVKDQPIEEGHAGENNAKRFIKKRVGLYVILEPVKNPEAYWKLPNYSNDNGVNEEKKVKLAEP